MKTINKTSCKMAVLGALLLVMVLGQAITPAIKLPATFGTPGAPAASGAISTIGDFEALANGDIDGQDNWTAGDGDYRDGTSMEHDVENAYDGLSTHSLQIHDNNNSAALNVSKPLPQNASTGDVFSFIKLYPVAATGTAAYMRVQLVEVHAVCIDLKIEMSTGIVYYTVDGSAWQTTSVTLTLGATNQLQVNLTTASTFAIRLGVWSAWTAPMSNRGSISTNIDTLQFVTPAAHGLEGFDTYGDGSDVKGGAFWNAWDATNGIEDAESYVEDASVAGAYWTLYTAGALRTCTADTESGSKRIHYHDANSPNSFMIYYTWPTGGAIGSCWYSYDFKCGTCAGELFFYAGSTSGGIMLWMHTNGKIYLDDWNTWTGAYWSSSAYKTLVMYPMTATTFYFTLDGTRFPSSGTFTSGSTVVGTIKVFRIYTTTNHVTDWYIDNIKQSWNTAGPSSHAVYTFKQSGAGAAAKALLTQLLTEAYVSYPFMTWGTPAPSYPCSLGFRATASQTSSSLNIYAGPPGFATFATFCFRYDGTIKTYSGGFITLCTYTAATEYTVIMTFANSNSVTYTINGVSYGPYTCNGAMASLACFGVQPTAGQTGVWTLDDIWTSWATTAPDVAPIECHFDDITLYDDHVAPATTCTFTPAHDTDFVNSSTLFTLNPTDGGSGIAQTWCKYTGKAWGLYTAPFTLSSATNGTISIQYCSMDKAGNNETLKSTYVQLDSIAPTTTISYTPAFAPAFVNATTTFTLGGSDNAGGSGLASRYYNLNNTGWVAGNTFDLGAFPNGTATIWYRSDDNVGNVETYGVLVVQLDTIAPNTTISYTIAYAPDFVNSTTTFTLGGTDNAGGSGIASRWYNSNGSGWVLYTAPFTLVANGTYSIDYRSVDNVGNVEAYGTATVRLDTIAANTTISYTPAYAPDFVNSTTSFTLGGSDNTGGSGVASRYYNINGSGWTAGNTFDLSALSNGTVTIWYRSIDNVGNIETYGVLVVQLDTIAPNTTISWTPACLPDFVNSTTLFTLGGADNAGGSGLASRWYNSNGSGWAAGNTFDLSALANGTVTIWYRSTDNVGNVETYGVLVVRLDALAPNTTISYVVAYAPDFVNVTTTFSLNASDNAGGSGVANTTYRLNGSAWVNYTAPFVLVGNGTWTVDYRSADNVGNVETYSTVVVRLDTLAPNTTIAYTIAFAPDFVNGTTTFTLNASDNTGGSGVASIWYRLNGGAWLPYTVPFTLAGMPDGTVTIDYRSIDNVGNVETFLTSVVQLDTGAPVTTLSYTPPWAPNYVNVNTTFTLGVVDSGSGVFNTTYRLNGGAWIAYAGAFTVGTEPGGIVTIQYNSTDNVGNVEGTRTSLVRLDKVAPNATTGYTPAFAPDFVTPATIFTITASDNSGGSGVASRWYNINATGWASGTTFTLTGWTNGTITIQCRAVDHVGNVGIPTSIVVHLDTIAPNTTISFVPAVAPDIVNSTTTFTLAGSDNTGGSGLASRYYNLNGSGWVAGNTFTPGAVNGTITIQYRSIDNVGNVETAGNITVHVDTIAPTVTIVYAPAWLPHFVTSMTWFMISAWDNAGGSGVASTWYNVAGTGWVAGNSFTLAGIPAGVVIIQCRAVDRVGNAGNATAFTVELGIATAILISFVDSHHGQAIAFDAVHVYINGTRVMVATPTVMMRCINITAQDLFGMAVNSSTFDLVTGGTTIVMQLPLVPVTVFNNYQECLVFVLEQHGTSIRKSIPARSSIQLDLALGWYNYTAENATGDEVMNMTRKRVTWGSPSIVLEPAGAVPVLDMSAFITTIVATAIATCIAILASRRRKARRQQPARGKARQEIAAGKTSTYRALPRDYADPAWHREQVRRQAWP